MSIYIVCWFLCICYYMSELLLILLRKNSYEWKK